MVFKIVGNEVYEAIKAELLSGIYPQGMKIDVALMAEKLHTSATPVRESLMRLLGEQLIEALPHIGFFTPRPTDARLRRLIDWSLYQLLPAIRGAATRPAARGGQFNLHKGGDPVESLEALFVAVAGLDGNPELKVSMSRTNERLRIARKLRQETPADVEAQVENMATYLNSHDYAGLEALIVEYHSGFHAMVPTIVERLEADGAQ